MLRRLLPATSLGLAALVLPRIAVAGGQGGAVVVDHAALVAYVADSDNGAVHRVDLISRAVVSTKVACSSGDKEPRPEQVAISTKGAIAVTLRGCNEVALLDVAPDGSSEIVASAPVAVDPVGLAVSPRGTLFVTSGYAHTLTALDAGDLTAQGTLDLPKEPRGIVLTSDGARAFVAHTTGDSLSVVDFGAAGEKWALHRVNALGGAYRNRIEAEVGADMAHPTASLGWSVILNGEGTRVFVPHLAVQNGADTTRSIAGSYGGVSIQEDTSVPSVAVMAVEGETVLGAAPRETKKTVARLRLNSDPFGGFSVPPVGSPARQVRGAAVLDDSLFVASLGTDELIELDARSIDPAMATKRTFTVASGPTGVDVDGTLKIAVVWSQFAHALSIVSLGSGSVEPIDVATDPLPADVAAGRRLFHTEVDRRISRDGRACAACHPEGREDGIVWKLGMGPRQTPMLVGRLTTGPYGWLGKHSTLEGNMAETITRLGGSGLPKADLEHIAAYLRQGLRAPVREASHDPLVERGRALFASERTGCSSCHSIDNTMSDRTPHDVGSRATTDEFKLFRTAPLLFVGDTAPYFHDGRYATLEALLDDNLDRMGTTSSLDAADRAALLAYLRSL